MSVAIAQDQQLALHGGPQAVSNPPIELWKKVDANAKKAVNDLLDAGTTTLLGNNGIVGEFERDFARLIGTNHAITMNSGTSALHSAFFAVGVGPGDEVIVPTYTWHATITPIIHCAATPVFCDIDANTLTIDPDDIERKITPRTKAICVVHVFGNVCDMDRIVAIADKHNIALIEDCSHAHGASWNGQKVGSFGKIGCFSMQGGKAVSGGESGVATTDDPELIDLMILLGHFGRQKIGSNAEVARVGDMNLGMKYRPHALAIALANSDLKRLPELNQHRTRNYELLNDLLRDCPGIEVIDALPKAERGGYLEFKYKLTPEVLEIANRTKIVEALAAEGAPVNADRYSDFNYTYGLLHTAPLFTDFDLHSIGGCFYDPSLTPQESLREKLSLPVAEDLSQRLLTIPAYVDVEEESLRQTAQAIWKVLTQVESL